MTEQPPANYPLQTVQFDATFSARLTVDRRMAGDDFNFVLKVHPKPTSGPGCDNLRVVCYAIRDLCTGLTRYAYGIAESINAADAIEELRFLLSDQRDPQRPMAGLPDNLWVDGGRSMHEVAQRLSGDVNVRTLHRPAPDAWLSSAQKIWAPLAAFETRMAEHRSETTLSEWHYLLANFERRQGWEPARPPASRIVAWTMQGQQRPTDNPLRPWPEAKADE